MARTGYWIGRGWQIVTGNSNHFWIFVLLTLVYLIATSVASSTVIGLLLNGPLTAALLAVFLYLVDTGRLDINRLQDGLNNFLHTMLAGLLIQLFTAIGLALCIIPGIIVAAFYLFPLLLNIDRRMEFWDAMEESRKRVQQDLVGFVVFVLALTGINILGALLFGVGLLVSIPVTAAAITVAYRELWPEQLSPIISTEPPAAP